MGLRLAFGIGKFVGFCLVLFFCWKTEIDRWNKVGFVEFQPIISARSSFVSRISGADFLLFFILFYSVWS